jgi:tetratricopeptide (TPR) repeat protein
MDACSNNVGQARRRFVMCLLLCLCMAPVVLAQAPQATEPLYADGANHLYNLDFREAEAAFLSLTKSHPDNPDYWNSLATTYWLKILYNQQKFNMETFSHKDRFGTDDSRDSGFDAEEKQFRAAIDKAMAVADAVLKKDPRNINAHYAKGVSYASLGSFEATIRRAWVTAARRAKAAREEHLQVLALDPNFHDARAAVGVYNYAVGSLSFAAKALVFMVGLGSGDKAGGIKDIELAASKGTRALVDSKMLLVVVYGREWQFEKARKLLDELHAKYPRNFMFDMTKAGLFAKEKKWDQAAQTYAQMIEKQRAKKDGYERMRVEKLYYELANAQFQGQKFGEAAATFELVAKAPNATANERANAHLWMGRMLDTSNKRNEAVTHYKAVLTLDSDPSLKNDARSLMKKPFGK